MDELLNRQVPHALDAEQSVLGSMLIDERCVPDVIGLLTPDDFYLKQNREIYETIYVMFNFSQRIDPVTVLDKMKERGVYDEQHSYDYIAQLLQITPTAANVKQYCAIVHDKALLRNLGTAAGEISDMVYEGVGTAQEIFEASEKKHLMVETYKRMVANAKLLGDKFGFLEKCIRFIMDDDGYSGREYYAEWLNKREVK